MPPRVPKEEERRRDRSGLLGQQADRHALVQIGALYRALGADHPFVHLQIVANMGAADHALRVVHQRTGADEAAGRRVKAIAAVVAPDVADLAADIESCPGDHRHRWWRRWKVGGRGWCGTRWSGANLRGLRGADLRGAKLGGARRGGAKLSGENMISADKYHGAGGCQQEFTREGYTRHGRFPYPGFDAIEMRVEHAGHG